MIAYCALLSAATVAVATLAIGVRERFSRVSVIYMLEGIAIIGWQVAVALGWLRGADHASQMAWITVGTMSALFIAPLNLSSSPDIGRAGAGCTIAVNLYLYYRQYRDNRPDSIAARRAIPLGLSLVGELSRQPIFCRPSAWKCCPSADSGSCSVSS